MKKGMVEKHKHCIVCGISIDPDKNPPVCSRKCEYILEKKIRRERVTMTIPFIFLAGFIVIMLLISTFFGT